MEDNQVEQKREKVLNIINPFGSKEPKWENIDMSLLPEKNKLSTLGFAYNWYSYNSTPSQHKKWVMEYCKNFLQEVNQEVLDTVNEKRFIPYGPTVRIFMNNGPINKSSLDKINFKIKNLEQEHILLFDEKQRVNKLKSFIKEEKEQEQISSWIGVIEDEIVKFIKSKHYTISFDYQKWVENNSVPKKVHLHIIKEWNQVKNELASNEPDYIEAYSHIPYKKKQELIRFIDSMNLTNASETPIIKKQRVRKPKPASKQIKKLKFMDNFSELNIKSINPEKIIGATNLWVYNTQYKILFNYHAEKDKTFEVKGTTLLNFDENLSVGKRLRKPDEVLTTFASGGKIAIKKTFESLKTKPIKTTGRINEHCILLKVF